MFENITKWQGINKLEKLVDEAYQSGRDAQRESDYNLGNMFSTPASNNYQRHIKDNTGEI